MMLLTGHTPWSQAMREVDEGIVMRDVTEYYLDLEIRTYIKGTSDVRKGLLRILIENPNIILSLVYCFNTVTEYFPKQKFTHIEENTLEETLIRLQDCKNGMYVLDWRFIECDSYYGYKFQLLPLSDMTVSEELNIKMRKLFIDDFLKDLC